MEDRMSTPKDAPIFDPAAFRLETREAEIIDKARAFGARVLAPRAAKHDREATFPIENFRDMHPEGLLGICVPERDGGLGAGFRTYCLAAAELGRYCGATALSWNMHVCSTLWTGALADDLQMSAEDRKAHNARRSRHYKRIVGEGAIYSQPFSEGGAAAAGAAAFGTEAKPVDGGFLVSGKKIFASLSGAADTTASCAPSAARAMRRAGATRSISPCRPRRRACRWWATGTRLACAARSRARCC
jgi:alkylation response protein AidB-like acyl-CoA dehydrogenase